MKNVVLAIALALSTGCASIVSDSDYVVHVDAPGDQEYTVVNEKGAPVFAGSGSRSIKLSAGGGFNCMDYNFVTPCGTTPLKAGIDGWVFGNILLGGWIGIIVDPLTGAACKLDEYVQLPEC
tara:strand:+ start:4783 stop:5148 length:366 start_codon:yes stop_codon:yes gene_type:complete